MKIKVIKIIVSLMLLLVGGLIYIAYRTEDLLMFSWFRALKMEHIICEIRVFFSRIEIPYFVKFCLPNGLWTASYLISVDALVKDKKLLWALVLPLIATVFEILQIWQIIQGTFDIGDLICILAPTIVYIVYYHIHYETSI